MTSMASHLDGIYLHRLVKSLLPAGSSDHRADAVYQELIEFAQSQAFQRQAAPELNQILSRIQRSIPPYQSEQLQRSVEQLLKYREPSQISRYLSYVLGLLDEQHQSTEAPFRQATMTDHPDRGDNRSLSNYAPTVASYENENMDRLSDRRSTYSTSHGNGSRSNTLEELLIPYFEDQVPESDILQYISYTLVGTTSTVLPLNEGEVILPDNMSNGMSGNLHAVLEVGLIYQNLTHTVDVSKSHRKTSHTKVALFSFISTELDAYVHFVNTLSVDSQLSLKSLYRNIYDWLVRLRFLHFILVNVGSLESYDIISYVHAYTLHGDPVLRSCSVSMFDYIMGPFLSVLTSWIVEGHLRDCHDEFFIEQVGQMQDGGPAIYRAERVPKFMPSELAEQVYAIGTTNHFLKTCCKETAWTNQFSQKSSFLLTQVKSRAGFSLGDSGFHKVVHALYDEIINFFTFIIYTKHHMKDVLKALCDYLLMAKGDFIEYIVSQGETLLNEPSSSLTGHQLTRLLHGSLLKTTSRFDLSHAQGKIILNNLDARLLAVGHGNVGWDVFTLDYRIETPLNQLLNNSKNTHKREYLRVFNHLWKIKRLVRMFSGLWKDFRQTKKIRDKKLRRIMLIHNFIYSFLSTIENFILLDIIDVSMTALFDELESSPNDDIVAISAVTKGLKVAPPVLKPSAEFLSNINNAKTTFQRLEHGSRELPIDKVQKKHESFLGSITHHTLLNGSNESSRANISGKSYIGQMNRLIDIAFKFVLAEREFNQLGIEVRQLPEDHVNSLAVRKRLHTIYGNLLILFNDFNSHLKVFVGDLTHDDDLQLRSLGITLNQ